MAFVLIVAGLALLTLGAEVLVRGAGVLARAMGLPALVIGLTVVAFGTSAPELAVSVQAALDGRADIAMGNVVGSNTFNVLFILGVSALIIPLAVSSQLVRLDVPVMIGVSGLAWLLAANGTVGRVEGAGLCAGLVGYTTILVILGRRQPDNQVEERPDRGRPAPGQRRWCSLATCLIMVAVGLGMLVLGARWFVSGAVDTARALGAGDLLIGLTVVAAGTSMPEVATSVMASVRGQRDIAVGNVVGSCIFNILGVLGVTAAVSSAGVAVAPAALRLDIPVMLVTAIACLPIFFTGGRISRREGALFLTGYAAYLALVISRGT